MSCLLQKIVSASSDGLTYRLDGDAEGVGDIQVGSVVYVTATVLEVAGGPTITLDGVYIPTYSQGFDLMGDPDPEVVAQGYAIATDTLNTFQVSCNDVLSAETAMMVKEHFIETHGLPDLTIGEGGSGGAIQQLLIARSLGLDVRFAG